MYQLSSDSEFAFILAEMLSLSNNFGANTGEILRAASQIKPSDFESWHREFKFLADGIHDKAVAINATRFPVSAREAYFRSASYYRAADFFLHGNTSDTRIYSLWNSALSDFDKAIELLPTVARRANVSAHNFTVPIIFYKPQESSNPHSTQELDDKGYGSRKLPTVLVGNGYDGSQEELYHSVGRSILDRGWNFVTYEGPGQPTVLRQQQLGFIPDWWDVVTPVMDYLAKRPDVDMRRVALVGISFGGTLAPRAASREHRLSAVLAINGLTSLFASLEKQFPPKLIDLFNSGNKTAFHHIVLSIMESSSYPTQFRWIIGQSLFAFNTRSPFEWFTRLSKFVADGPLLRNITCPTFVASGENDSSAPGQPEEMAELLGDKCTYNLFKTDLGAGEHCQLGAEAQVAQVALDWLGDIWDGVKTPRSMTGRVY
ncbi:2,6-dihydropseudooxynicotine hydrolase [Tolypocladium ophioglossoides CBS 100239]|uniref:2,6-dihydropseudooxynicotine hydrolase n=1 Tax=Tolypocladium ophioglossoides (strain CBS 100239) TaxID=1163406 RepID=A0A0L0MY78_TOLOC|nr:2,6-dihydropseudooxynicotine hydrolase [Tolypocladium ophioglossoides CBS 100239]